MTALAISKPLVFQPLFMERIWGGRRLETLYGKHLPAGVPIGESWELVDRPEAQSVVDSGPWRGRTLHDLWLHHRREIFGTMADAPRFPLLIKLLDAHDKLSVQVHPPAEDAAELGGEPKTECWYIVQATAAAELFVGIARTSSREAFKEAIENGDADKHLHRIAVKADDAMFLPSGRVHAIGAGNLILEVQQNSDTTYRVFDWNRTDADGAARTLHVAESLQCINFDDREPALVQPDGETLVDAPLFHLDRWELRAPRPAAAPGEMAILCCISGGAVCAGVALAPGGLFLVPAALENRMLEPLSEDTVLVRVTIPDEGES